MFIHPSRAAGQVTISRPDKQGNLQVVGIVPAGTLETAKVSADDLRGKPGCKAGTTTAGQRASRFAESENAF